MLWKTTTSESENRTGERRKHECSIKPKTRSTKKLIREIVLGKSTSVSLRLCSACSTPKTHKNKKKIIKQEKSKNIVWVQSFVCRLYTHFSNRSRSKVARRIKQNYDKNFDHFVTFSSKKENLREHRKKLMKINQWKWFYDIKFLWNLKKNNSWKEIKWK